MAHQLKALGEEVALLAIFDSFPPDPITHPAREPGPLRHVRHRLALHWTTLRVTTGGRGHGRLHDQSKDLARRYRGQPWGGCTIVFVADSDQRAQRRAWKPFLSGDWRLVEVQGDHRSMNHSPWVELWADVLADELARADASPRG